MASTQGLPLTLVTSGAPPQAPASTARHQGQASSPATMAARFAPSHVESTGDITTEEGAFIIFGMKFSSPPPKPLKIHGMPWLHLADLRNSGYGLLDIPVVEKRKFAELGWEGTREEPGSVPVRETEPISGVGHPEYIPDFEEQWVEPVLEQVIPYTPLTQPKSPTPSVFEFPLSSPEKRPATVSQGPYPKRFKRIAAKSVKPSSPVLSLKPTRKSSRLAFKPPTKPPSKDMTPIALHDTSTESFSSSDDHYTPPVSTHSESTKSSPIRPLPKKATPTTSSTKSTKTTKHKRTPNCEAAEASTPKRAKRPAAPSPKLKNFLKRNIVRGKVINPVYFQEQGLDLFLEKLNLQGWLEIFTDDSLHCSAPDIAEFYATVSVEHGVVTAKVGGVRITFDAEKLGLILEIPSAGVAAYVREEKGFLSQDQYLELARKLGQNPTLSRPTSIKKGQMTPMHQLIFWFVIKNVIPRGQGRNLADAMDQHLTDLFDSGVPINLPAIMIRHIYRIATNTKDHMLGYGFLLTRVLEYFGVKLKKKIGVQSVDFINSTTLLGCDFNLHPAQEAQTPPPPVPATSSSTTPGSMVEEVARQKSEIAEIRAALEAERAVNEKRHEDILSLFSSLLSKINPPDP